MGMAVRVMAQVSGAVVHFCTTVKLSLNLTLTVTLTLTLTLTYRILMWCENGPIPAWAEWTEP